MKRAYFNNENEYDNDNFEYLTNEDIQSDLDKFENRNRDGTPLKLKEEEKVDKDKLDEADGDKGLSSADFAPGMYGQMHGVEGLNAYPLEYYGDGLTEDPGAITNNPYNNI